MTLPLSPQASFFCELAQSEGRDWTHLDAHTHDEGLIFILTGGLIQVETPDSAWCACPGQLGWIAPGVLHKAIWPGVARGIFLYVAATHCAAMQRPCAVAPLTPLGDALMHRFLQVQQSRAPLAESRIVAMLGLLFDELSDNGIDAQALPMPSSLALLLIARTLLDQPHRSDPVSEWARMASMSSSTLLRHFKGETGLSFTHWRQRARMVLALTQLVGGQSVTAAASSVGYDNVSAFIDAFSRHYGMPPRRYLEKGLTRR